MYYAFCLLPYASALCLLVLAFCRLSDTVGCCILPLHSEICSLPFAYALFQLRFVFQLSPSTVRLLPIAFYLWHSAVYLLLFALCLLPSTFCRLPTAFAFSFCRLPSASCFCRLPFLSAFSVWPRHLHPKPLLQHTTQHTSQQTEIHANKHFKHMWFATNVLVIDNVDVVRCTTI